LPLPLGFVFGRYVTATRHTAQTAQTAQTAYERQTAPNPKPQTPRPRGPQPTGPTKENKYLCRLLWTFSVCLVATIYMIEIKKGTSNCTDGREHGHLSGQWNGGARGRVACQRKEYKGRMKTQAAYCTAGFCAISANYFKFVSRI